VPASGAASSLSPTPTATPVPISAWPKKISPVAAAPRLIQQQAIHAGYAGDAYVRKIAAKWHITMPKKSDPSFSGQSKEPVLSSVGTAHPRHDAELTLDAVWDSKGDLLLIECVATASAPQTREFLHDCTKPDYPGAKPTDTAAWLDATEPALDKAHKDHGTVVSPMHRTGPTATYMSEWTDATYGDTYTAEIIGVP
jgi:hypothetical protein